MTIFNIDAPKGTVIETETKSHLLFNGIRLKKKNNLSAIADVNRVLTNLVSDLVIALGDQRLEFPIACYLSGNNQSYFLNIIINSISVERNNGFSILGPQLMRLREEDEVCHLYSPEEKAMLDEMIEKIKVMRQPSDGIIDHLKHVHAVITKVAIVTNPVELARSIRAAVLQQQQIVGSEKR